MQGEGEMRAATNGAGRPGSPGRHPETVVILGGGVAGLTTGLELRRRGWPVTILEREEEVGGLARTVTHDGFRFDVGGHRFHSHNPRLLDWLGELLGDDLLQVSRRSHIYLQDEFIPYPLQFPQALRIFPPRQLARVLGSYLAAQIKRATATEPAASFEAWVVRRFGRALYEIYFRPYTEKVWGIPCHELSADWAAQRISLPSLLAAIRRAIYAGRRPPATVVSQFHYPRCGFGMIAERLAQEIRQMGGEIITGATVTELAPAAHGFTVGYRRQGQRQQRSADRVISTIPLDALLGALPKGPATEAVEGLDYRDLICVFLAVEGSQVSGDHWTYFPQPELIFGRTHEPKNWSAAMAPEGMTSLVAEIFTSRGEPVWQTPDEALARQTVQQLDGLPFLSRRRVVDRRVLRIKNAYPIYRIGYVEKLKETRRHVDRFRRLHLVGRTGAFRYLNSDGVIEDAFALVDWLTGQAPRRVGVGEAYVVP